MWQDIIITITQILLAWALVPQIIKGFKNKKQAISLQTSSITFAGMYILTFVYFTLSLYFATVSSFIIGTLWLIMFIQRIIYKN
jgi:hypothetical protein